MTHGTEFVTSSYSSAYMALNGCRKESVNAWYPAMMLAHEETIAESKDWNGEGKTFSLILLIVICCDTGESHVHVT